MNRAAPSSRSGCSTQSPVAALHSRTRPAEFIVLSEWESLDAFQTWEQGPVHRGTLLESLRRYTTGAAFFDVLAAY